MSLFSPSLFDLPPAAPLGRAAAAPAPAPCEEPEPAAGAEPAELKMRPYQERALAAVLEAFGAHRSTLVVSATGTGKTVLFAHLIDAMADRGRVMVLAHREELIRQAKKKIQTVTGQRPTVEMGDQWADLQHYSRARVVVSSVQTQIAGLKGKGRMTRFDPRDFCLLIVDEAHRAVAPSYRRTIDYYLSGNPDLRLLGVTATPDRADQQALGKVFQSVAFRLAIHDAIDEGWLTPVRQRSVTVTGLDFSKVRTTAGDLNGADLAAVLEYEENLHRMAAPVLELAGPRQTIVFCASVAHAERFAEILNRHRPGIARSVTGETPKNEREALFHDYERRKFQVLCNVGVATEGTDIAGIEVVVLARPTKSRALFEQMIGRGTRPLPGVVDGPPDAAARRAAIAASAKPFCQVIDFVGNSGRHKLVCVADVLGDKYSEEVRARAAKKAREASAKGLPADVAEQLRLAEAEVEEHKRRRDAKERAEQERRKHVVAASVNYKTKEIDPFAFYQVAPPREVNWDKAARPTPAQVEFLAKRGIDVTRSTRGEAGRLIQQLRGRITPNQARLLCRCGYAPAEVKDLSTQDASRLIEKAKANGWHRPAASDASAPEREVMVI